MKLLPFLVHHPVFRLEELEAFLHARGTDNEHTIQALIAYHIAQGHILRIRRGLYASVPIGSSPDEQVVDPYLVASRLADDAVIAYHSALQFHGKAYSLHHRHYYLAKQRLRPFSFQGQEYVAVTQPKTPGAVDDPDPGIEQISHRGLSVRVTSLERTLVDVLAEPDKGGGWEELDRSLEMIEFVDLDAVVDYTLRFQNAAIAARVGYYLERRQQEWMVDATYLERLASCAPRQPRYLDRRRFPSGRLVKPWNLIIPPSLLDRSWEEPE